MNKDDLLLRLSELEKEKIEIERKLRDIPNINILLSFIREHAICIWENYTSISIEFNNIELKNQFFSLIKPKVYEYNVYNITDTIKLVIYRNNSTIYLKFNYDMFDVLELDVNIAAMVSITKLKLKLSFAYNLSNVDAAYLNYTTLKTKTDELIQTYNKVISSQG